MALWPIADSGLQSTGGQIVSSSLWTTVTGGAANMPGNWFQMFSATPFTVTEVVVFMGQTGLASSTLNVQGLLDIGTGIAGSEALLVQNVGIGGVGPFAAWRFPVLVQDGIRIAVRIRCATASRSCTMGMALQGGGTPLNCGSGVVTYGAVTSGSRGTILTAPGAINTEAAWTAITTSTTAPARWLVVGLNAPNTAAVTAAEGLLDVGVGGAGSEQSVINDVPFQVTAAEQINFPSTLTFPADIAVGARLSARYRATSTLTTASPSVTLTGIA